MKTIAFYLPQFHAIPENDEWWGKGFTEWFNVRRAQPQFHGHDHPREAGAMGEYDLLDRDVHSEQTALARQFGVDAFCMYFYWFNGRRLLEKPVDMWRDDPDLLPYCLSWANEAWTRRWDGKERDVLMPQGYLPGFEEEIFADLLPHFRAPHYLRQDGLPVLVVHRADLIPDPREFARRIRERAVEEGLGGVHLVAAETTPGLSPEPLGFDAVAEFPPVGANTLKTAHKRPLRGISRNFRGRLMSYDRLVEYYSERPQVDFVRYPSVAPGWDNTARRQENATVYVGATPSKYAGWLGSARRREGQARGERGLVFINAWNEWAEGAYLEPDGRHGTAYLEATAPTSGGLELASTVHAHHALFWSYPHVRSLVLAFAGSLLALRRRARNRAARRRGL